MSCDTNYVPKSYLVEALLFTSTHAMGICHLMLFFKRSCLTVKNAFPLHKCAWISLKLLRKRGQVQCRNSCYFYWTQLKGGRDILEQERRCEAVKDCDLCYLSELRTTSPHIDHYPMACYCYAIDMALFIFSSILDFEVVAGSVTLHLRSSNLKAMSILNMQYDLNSSLGLGKWIRLK